MVESFRQKVYKNIRYNCLYIDPYFKIKAGYRHPRSIPIISPSKEFDANVKKIFDKGSYTSLSSFTSNIFIYFQFTLLSENI